MFHISLALLDGPAHGYRLMQDVEELSRGATRLGPGTLYRSIQRMQVDGLLDEVGHPGDAGDLRRRSYQLTAAGYAAAREEASRLAVLVRAAEAHGLISSTNDLEGALHV